MFWAWRTLLNQFGPYLPYCVSLGVWLIYPEEWQRDYLEQFSG